MDQRSTRIHGFDAPSNMIQKWEMHHSSSHQEGYLKHFTAIFTFKWCFDLKTMKQFRTQIIFFLCPHKHKEKLFDKMHVIIQFTFILIGYFEKYMLVYVYVCLFLKIMMCSKKLF